MKEAMMGRSTRFVALVSLLVVITGCASSIDSSSEDSSTTTVAPTTVAPTTVAPSTTVATVEPATDAAAEPMDVELALDMGDNGFTATGVAVDEGIMCPEGMLTQDPFFTLDGEQITTEQWLDTFWAADADDVAAEIMNTMGFACAYGTGSFTMDAHVLFDFATIDMDAGGQDPVGTWTIVEGTGDQTGITGAGDLIGDWDEGFYRFPGEVQNG